MLVRALHFEAEDVKRNALIVKKDMSIKEITGTSDRIERWKRIHLAQIGRAHV